MFWFTNQIRWEVVNLKSKQAKEISIQAGMNHEAQKWLENLKLAHSSQLLYLSSHYTDEMDHCKSRHVSARGDIEKDYTFLVENENNLPDDQFVYDEKYFPVFDNTDVEKIAEELGTYSLTFDHCHSGVVRVERSILSKRASSTALLSNDFSFKCNSHFLAKCIQSFIYRGFIEDSILRNVKIREIIVALGYLYVQDKFDVFREYLAFIFLKNILINGRFPPENSDTMMQLYLFLSDLQDFEPLRKIKLRLEYLFKANLRGTSSEEAYIIVNNVRYFWRDTCYQCCHGRHCSFEIQDEVIFDEE